MTAGERGGADAPAAWCGGGRGAAARVPLVGEGHLVGDLVADGADEPLRVRVRSRVA
jgi:hypothetical protein